MESIMVALDLEAGTGAVMAQVRKYARALDAQVVLVNIEPLLPGAESADSEEVARDLRENYDSETSTILSLGAALTAEGIDNRVLVIEGSAVDQLVAEAQREQPSLAIIGNHRHGALREAVTYGLRDQLARRLECPLLLVPVE